jgi:16S rRNA U1498 N3-methylase RsmE
MKDLIRLFHPLEDANISKNMRLQLPEEESTHLRSLRVRPDETFELFNGKGLTVKAQLAPLETSSNHKKKRKGDDGPEVILLEDPCILHIFYII